MGAGALRRGRGLNAALDAFRAQTRDDRNYKLTRLSDASAPPAKPVVYRLTSPDRDLVMKYDPTGDGSDQIAREFNALSALKPVFARFPGHDVVTPVHLDADRQFLIMNYAEGATALDAVTLAGSEESLHDVGAAGGGWLSVLHGSAAPKPARYSPDWVVRRLDDLMGRRGSQAPALGPARCADLVEALRPRLDIVRNAYCLRVPSHGDFNGRNLIFAADTALGLDVGRLRAKLAVYDVADFITELDLRAPDGAVWDARGRATGPLMQGFLTGYGRPLPNGVLEVALISRMVIAAFRITRTERRWQKHRRLRLARIMSRLEAILG
jgi:Ser/Thr protein kinase RdoA (MazF antagonist)